MTPIFVEFREGDNKIKTTNMAIACDCNNIQIRNYQRVTKKEQRKIDTKSYRYIYIYILYQFKDVHLVNDFQLIIECIWTFFFFKTFVNSYLLSI